MASNYSKWDKLDSSDDEDAKPKVVRKQAVAADVEKELQTAAEEARLAAEEGDRLEQQMAELERKLMAVGQADQLPADADAAEDSKGDNEAADDDLADGAVVAGTSGASGSESQAPSRRRRLDHTREAEAEREFEVIQQAAPSAPEAEQAQAVAAALATATTAVTAEVPADPGQRSSDQDATCSAKTAPSFLAAAEPVRPPGPSTLRRLKQLDAATSGAIEQECGVALRSSDSFRLTLDNSSSWLKRQTRVLIVMAGSTFLCEEPISEEATASPQAEHSSADGITSPKRACDADPPSTREAEVEEGESAEGEYEDDFEDFDEEDEDGGSVVAELCFFRAKPSRGGLARKLGTVPVLHVTLSTSDGLRENLEFVGVHQRGYCVEEPNTDAIAAHCERSLLKVALEFVFHPSRTRYTKERLVLRECSTSAEARKNREAMMPRMAQEVQKNNSKIEKVSCEFLPPRVRLSGSAALKGRSFLILDEDVLKVAPAKDTITVNPAIKGSFKGLGQGFLNTSNAKRRGLSKLEPAVPLGAGQASASSSSSPPKSSASSSPLKPSATSSSASTNGAGDPCSQRPPSPAAAAGASAGEEPSRGTSAADTEEEAKGVTAEARPPPVQTDHAEKRRLLLGGMDVEPRVTSDLSDFARRVIPGCGDLSVTTIPEEEEDLPEDQGPANIDELANQLFGSGDDHILNELDASGDDFFEDRTESTHTPSPKGTSLCGGAPSERSEPATEDGVDVDASLAPAAGIRLLQQRRRERGTGQSEAAAGGAATSSETRDESEDLVQLWMKQRW